MSMNLCDENNDFFREDIENSMVHEFKKFKKHKKSKKKNKKKQKKLKNKRIREMEKRITKRVTKKVMKKLKKYIKKYKESDYDISLKAFEKIIKQLICKSLYQRIIQSLNTIRLDENNSIIDLPYKENEK